MHSLPDPRIFPLSATGPSDASRRWHALAAEAAEATGLQRRAELEATLARAVGDAFASGDIAAIVGALDASRSAAEYRQLWRAVIGAWRSHVVASAQRDGAGVAVHTFAMPVVLVTAGERDADLPLTIGRPQAVVDAMRAHGALEGNENFGIAGVLVGEAQVGLHGIAGNPPPSTIDRAAAWIDAFEASPLRVAAGHESAHLRWIPGSALAAPTTDLFVERSSGKWGMKVAALLSDQARTDGVQALALPGAPADIISAWQHGVVAHRDVALQLYVTTALRNLRAAYGEPGAVISAHRIASAASSGELRISLSSPFGERDAEGFRCPLHPFERIDDVLKTIADLLAACRVEDVTVLAGLHPERDARTGLPLFFRSDALPDRTGMAS